LHLDNAVPRRGACDLGLKARDSMAANVDTRQELESLTKHIAAAACVFVAILLLFHDTAWATVSTWYSSNAYNHGFLILPICFYLAWRQRAKAAATEIRPDLRGLVFVALAAACWLVGEATGTMLIREMSLVLIVQSVFLTLYGWRMWRTFMFPLLYLFFAVPAGMEIEPRLQAVTASVAVHLLSEVGIPVFSDGNIISIPTGTFYVAEECSGLRFLTASIAVGTLFAGIIYRAWWRRILFIILAATFPVVANGLRAFGIISLTYLTSNEFGAGVDHITYGWIFFTLVTFLLLAIGSSFRERGAAEPVSVPVSVSLPGDASLGRIAGAGVAAMALVALTAFYGARIDHRMLGEPPRLAAPAREGAWTLAATNIDPLPPVFAAPDIQLHTTYVSPGSAVHLDLGYYLRNRRGAQIVSSDHMIGERKGWIVAAAGTKTVKIGDESLSVRFVRTVGKNDGRVTWYWYWIDDRFTGNPYIAKLLEAKVKLLGGDPRAAIIAIGADYSDNEATADKALHEFASTLTWLGPFLRGELAPSPGGTSK
jgi:exosortase A